MPSPSQVGGLLVDTGGGLGGRGGVDFPDTD